MEARQSDDYVSYVKYTTVQKQQGPSKERQRIASRHCHAGPRPPLVSKSPGIH